MPITDDEKKAKVRERRELGRKMRPSWKLSTEQKEDLIDGYVAGESVGELAQRFGIRRQTVAYHLDRACGED